MTPTDRAALTITVAAVGLIPRRTRPVAAIACAVILSRAHGSARRRLERQVAAIDSRLHREHLLTDETIARVDDLEDVTVPRDTKHPAWGRIVRRQLDRLPTSAPTPGAPTGGTA